MTDARIVFKTAHPRAGGLLEGTLRLAKPAKPGDVFRVELACTRGLRSVNQKRRETAFFEQQDIPVVRIEDGWGLPFRFDVPAWAPQTMERNALATDGYGDGFDWQIAFYPANAWIAFPSKLPIRLDAAPEEALRAMEAGETAEQKEALDAMGEALGSLLPYERAQVLALPPENFAIARKASALPGKIIKWVAILFFLVPTVLIVLMFAFGALVIGK
jgi:hypothetical protein